jgi:DNA-binding SARP family transcriptional activator/tetratricopeptide (TPR) repeat protein
MSVVRLVFLGPPAVERDGVPVSFDTRKAVALLALLAVTGREHGRDQLAALLWPDSDLARARASLRRTLSVTAAQLGAGLTVTRSTVGLADGMVRADVTDFESLVARSDAASLQAAARLYRDDFLAGFTLRDCAEFEDWQAAQASRLRQLLARALQRLVTTCTGEGALDVALDHARRWLALDELHEPAHQAVIRLLGWTGQRSAALRQYRTLVRVLDRELAVRPLPATTQLYEQIRVDQLGPPPAAERPTSGAATGEQAAAAAERWPLVGRDAELGTLTARLRAGGTTGRVAAVVGEAGSGKTSLVRELVSVAADLGGTVVAGRCHEGEEGLPFVLAADLLRGCLAARPDLPTALPADTAGLVGRLVPRLAAAHPDVPRPALDSPVAVTRMYAAIAETLAAAVGPALPPGSGVTADRGAAARPAPAAARSPALVLVIDAHWADASSLDLLGYLVRRVTELPALLVVSWRPEHTSRLRGLRAAVAEQEEAGLGTVVELAPLDARQLAALLRAVGRPDVDAARLFAETQGLPLLVRAYLQAAPQASGQPSSGQQGPEPAGGEWWPTGSVRELLRDRLLAVSEPTVQVLTAAAVLGGDCDADLLRAVSGRTEDEVVEAIDDAVARLLLAEVAPAPAGGQAAPSYRFPYQALRRTAYELATLARRRLLHGRAADALARRHERDPMSAATAVIADHLQRAGRDSEAAGWWWLAATRARALYAHADACEHLTRALALGYPEIPGRVALGEVLIALGRYTEALAEFETAAAAVPDDDRAQLAVIEHKLAEIQHRLGNWDLAAAHLAAVQDLLPSDRPGLRARAYADQALVAFRAGDGATAATLGTAALAVAADAADGGASAQALNVLGMVAASDGLGAEAERYLRASLASAREAAESGTVVAALNNLGRLLADTGRADEALAVAEEALAAGHHQGDQHRLAALHTNLADLLHAAGRRDEAMSHLKEAARRFAAVDAGAGLRPEIWTLVEW